jgi:hypothetical protein
MNIPNPQAIDAYYKAQTLAYWSFAGLFIPLLGVILGAIARSRLRLIVGSNQNEQHEIDRIRRIAGWGYGISLTIFITQVIIVVVWFMIIGIAVGGGR